MAKNSIEKLAGRMGLMIWLRAYYSLSLGLGKGLEWRKNRKNGGNKGRMEKIKEKWKK
jgi:hypothetical protein